MAAVMWGYNSKGMREEREARKREEREVKEGEKEGGQRDGRRARAILI